MSDRETGPEELGPDESGPEHPDAAAEPDGAEPDGAEPDGAEPDGAEPDGAEPDGAGDVSMTDGTEPAAAAAEADHTLDTVDADDGDTGLVDDASVRPSIEAILLVVDEPIPSMTLATVLDQPQPVVEQTLHELARSYTDQGRGFELREVAGGWRLYTRAEYADVVERFVLDGQQARLTQAALETLAVVAYRQPVNRSRVSAIRGVNCDGVMRTLVTRGLVQEAGSDTETGATLYRTTTYFLERLGLQSLEELPDLAPYLPEVDQLDPERGSGSLPATTPAPAPDADDDPAATADDDPAATADDDPAATVQDTEAAPMVEDNAR